MALRNIDPRDMENAVKMIGDDWTLITAEKKDGTVNTMTASWGFMGVIWYREVVGTIANLVAYANHLVYTPACCHLRHSAI